MWYGSTNQYAGLQGCGESGQALESVSINPLPPSTQTKEVLSYTLLGKK